MTTAKRDALRRIIQYAIEEACRQDEKATATYLQRASQSLQVVNNHIITDDLKSYRNSRDLSMRD
jgi:hypothetical protein